MKGDRLAMSSKERARKLMLSGVKEGKLSLMEASKKLKISYRQIKRIYQRFRLFLLVHQNAYRANAEGDAALKGKENGKSERPRTNDRMINQSFQNLD